MPIKSIFDCKHNNDQRKNFALVHTYPRIQPYPPKYYTTVLGGTFRLHRRRMMVCSGREVVVAGTAASKRPFTFSQPTGPAPTSTKQCSSIYYTKTYSVYVKYLLTIPRVGRVKREKFIYIFWCDFNALLNQPNQAYCLICVVQFVLGCQDLLKSLVVPKYPEQKAKFFEGKISEELTYLV